MSDALSETVSTGEEPPAGGAHAAEKKGSFFRELPVLLLVALVLALLIKAFLVQAFYIPSGSMQQTLEIRDRVLVNKLVYDFREVHRGEIVVFDGEGSFTEPETVLVQPSGPVQRALQAVGGFLGLGVPGEKDFIKRVIGVEGDRVACCTDGKVTVQPAGSDTAVVLEEPYLFEDDQRPFCEAGATAELCPPGSPGVLVPEGRLFVMGDHRGASRDSRFYLDDANNGTVPVDRVIGRAFVVVWPLDRAAVLRVPDTFDGPLAAGVVAVPYALGLVGALPVVALRRRLRRA
ncbi:MAG TPA: signal peptidase I [Mycobacteriales bacterium]|nr:signal peptidase I [Mycobacteriales bacterium]